MLWNIDFKKIPELLTYVPDDPLIFSTSLFLILFTVFLLFYNAFAKSNSTRIGFLIAFSIYFYYKSAGYYTVILILSAVINYLFGKWIFSAQKHSTKRLHLILALIISCGISC